MPAQAFILAQRAALARHEIAFEELFVETPSVAGRAHVLVAGDGPAVVLLNGIGTPAAMWAPLMAQLNGFTMYAVDLPGYGLTDTTAQLTDRFRSTAVRFLAELLDGLGLHRPTLIGNSLGSLWATWFAIDRPSRVAGLVHVGCPAIVLDTSAPLPMRLLSVPLLGRLMMKLQPPSSRQVRGLSKMVREFPLPSEIADLLLATEQQPGFESTFLATLQTLIRLRGSRPGMRLTADHLRQVRQPSLLIFGVDDPMGGAPVGRRLAEALPDAQLHIVEGGHAPWLHHAEQIGPLVAAFVAQHTELQSDNTVQSRISALPRNHEKPYAYQQDNCEARHGDNLSHRRTGRRRQVDLRGTTVSDPRRRAPEPR